MQVTQSKHDALAEFMRASAHAKGIEIDDTPAQGYLVADGGTYMRWARKGYYNPLSDFDMRSPGDLSLVGMTREEFITARMLVYGE